MPAHISGAWASGTTAPAVSWSGSSCLYVDACERRVVREILYLDQDLRLSSTRQLYRWLEQNAIVCVALEGRMERKHVLLPFLGKPRPFATGLVSLARLSRAPLLPLYLYGHD